MAAFVAPFRFVACVAILSLGGRAAAQPRKATTPSTTKVIVNGRSIRVSATGIELRTPGQPVLILESGAGEEGGIDEWTPAIPALAKLAPVISYDRHGIGQSDPDTQPRTIRRVAVTLHELLQAMRVPPPYVLVGHSWGGILIRGFAELYGSEVAGLVFIEAMDSDTTRQEFAAALPEAERKDALEPPEVPTIPPDTPPGLRAEYEDIRENLLNDFAEARTLKPRTDVPISVVVATPPGRLKHPGDVQMRLAIRHWTDLVLGSTNGLLIVSGDVKHNIAGNDPELVAQAVRHVLNNAQAKQ